MVAAKRSFDSVYNWDSASYQALRHKHSSVIYSDVYKQIHTEHVLWTYQFEPDEAVVGIWHTKGPEMREVELAVKAWVDGDKVLLIRYIQAHPKCRWAKRAVQSMIKGDAMPLSMTKIPAIKPGQVYECTQKHHKGWLVEVVKVSDLHIEARGIAGNQAARSKAHSKNGNYNYLRSQFERDYMLIRDVDEAPTRELAILQQAQPIQEQQQDSKFCPRCYQLKSLAEFGLTPTGGKPFSNCTKCRTELRLETMKLRGTTTRPSKPKLLHPVDQDQAVVNSYKIKEAEATPAPSNNIAAGELANQLVELASRVEQLSYPIALLEAVRDVLLEATDAHGVIVLPASALDNLQKEYTAVKDYVTWPSQPTNGTVR